jgi:hypothetical protein
MTKEYDDILARLLAVEATLPPPPKEYLTAAEAAEFIGFSLIQLAEWRCRQSGGPAFLKIGRRVAYRVADLRAFMDAHLVRER